MVRPEVLFNNEAANNLMLLLSQDQITAFLNEGQHCASRDIFQAKLDSLYHNLHNSLLVAVCGEIGNNSFDHNLGNWRDLSGVYFECLTADNVILLADRGQGVRKTLSRIVPNLSSDREAIETAFTRTISGRSPEQRGNGLKFVAAAAKKNAWKLYFQSGRGNACIADGIISFSESVHDLKGCLAVIKY